MESKIQKLTRVCFTYFDEDSNEYYVTERDMNTVPNIGEEIFLDTGNFDIDADGWYVDSRVCSLRDNEWLLTIRHRNDKDGKIWRFK